MVVVRLVILAVITLAVPLVLLGSCALILGAPMLFVGGPMILSPTEYRLAMTITLDIDGQRQTYIGDVKCLTYDQRDSVVRWSTKAHFVQPSFSTANGGGLLVTSLSPCRWTEHAPEPGVVYQLEPSAGAHAGGGRPARESFSSGGYLQVLDNAVSPTLVTSVPFAAIAETAVGGIRLVGMTLEAIDEPVEATVGPVFPIKARVRSSPRLNADMPLDERRRIEAIQTVYRVVANLRSTSAERPCGAGDDDTWIVIADARQCSGGSPSPVQVEVSADYGRVDISPEHVEVGDVTRHFYAPSVVATGRGAYASGNYRREAIFFWEPQVCIEGTCHDGGEALGRSGVVLWNAHRGQVLQVEIRRGELRDLLDR